MRKTKASDKDSTCTLVPEPTAEEGAAFVLLENMVVRVCAGVII